MSMGAWLRSEPLSAYQAKGAHGDPAFRSAAQLRRAVQVRLGGDTADFLAVPKINEQGDRIDWYAPFPGDVVPPASQTEEERADAHAQARAMQERIRAAATEHRARATTRDDTLFADLLTAAAEFPDGNHVYLVDGRPVATFWGFTHIGLDETSWAIRPPVVAPAPDPVPEQAAPSVAPVPPPPVARSWFPFLAGCLPFLLLPLLALGLLFGLRGCAPDLVEPYVARVAPSLPDLFGWTKPAEPERPAEPPTVVVERPMVPTVPPTPDAVTPDAVPAVPVTPVVPADPAPEATAPMPPPPLPEHKPTPPAVPPATLPPPAPGPLVIPEEARKQGRVDFLEGNWRSRTDLYETRSGQPVVVDYSFDRKGGGTLTIRQKNGVVCQGPAQARMQDGRLTIDGLNDPTCSDGSAFTRSRIDCTVGEGGRAACQGRHSNGRTFQVDMQR
ncbi:SrfA family protein [Azospirillum soli]|uniref:SrfA family protein n=1 Tax=Azospirillum soli TaxID=1304799 RepID=UPI001AE349FA|nr:SrfA family protein [Azospirillum soli]MBP2312697.1 hypothetical protein [Azospirillum soli]